MARCPFARQLLLPQNATQPRIHPRKAILHTAVDNAGKTTLFNWFQDPRARGAESTFFVKMDGIIEQYMDTEVRADAQWDANVDAVSIETEDDGDPSKPWNQAQLASIIRLLDWICTTHVDVARTLCPTPTGSGIGWHELFPQWNHSAHDCPGEVRENQIRTIILPALALGNRPDVTPPAQENDMTPDARFVQIEGQGPVYLATNQGHATHCPTEAAMRDAATIVEADGGKILDPPAVANAVTTGGFGVWVMSADAFQARYGTPV